MAKVKRNAKAKRKDIQSELDLIRRNHRGLLRPRDVVEFAKNPATTLHAKFEWDDDKAGSEYRLWQARNLIEVYVTVIQPDLEPVRAYVSLQQDRKRPGGGYRAIGNVMANAKLRESLLSEALQELDRFKAKYAALKELVPVFKAMSKVAKSREKAA